MEASNVKAHKIRNCSQRQRSGWMMISRTHELAGWLTASPRVIFRSESPSLFEYIGRQHCVGSQARNLEKLFQFVPNLCWYSGSESLRLVDWRDFSVLGIKRSALVYVISDRSWDDANTLGLYNTENLKDIQIHLISTEGANDSQRSTSNCTKWLAVFFISLTKNSRGKSWLHKLRQERPKSCYLQLWSQEKRAAVELRLLIVLVGWHGD